MMLRILTLSLAFFLAACGDKDTGDTDTTEEADTDTDTDSDTDTDTDTDGCASLDVDACAANGACAVITGRTLQETAAGVCVDFGEDPIPLGCMDAKGGCGDAETLAAESEGSCTHWFSSTCLPQGWTACDEPTWADECP